MWLHVCQLHENQRGRWWRRRRRDEIDLVLHGPLREGHVLSTANDKVAQGGDFVVDVTVDAVNSRVVLLELSLVALVWRGV